MLVGLKKTNENNTIGEPKPEWEKMGMQQYLMAAIANIAKHGDTDIFPFPIENHIFYDKPGESLTLLEEIHNRFEDYYASWPPTYESTLTSVGYNGFRWATQLDPFWNAYLLALVASVGDDIER